MQIENLLILIEKLLPRESAMEGDRLGLQIQSDNNEVRKFLITLEVTEEVVEEANSSGSDCIITFHPLIYYPLPAIVNDDRVGYLSKKLITSNISLVSVHTNFDAFMNGTSKLLSDKLGLKVISALVPDKLISGCGMGVIASSEIPLTQEDLLKKISEVCSSPIRFSVWKKSGMINKVAIVGGSGSSFINEAIANECDVFITADLTYHQFHQVNKKIMLVDPGHYEMEQFVPEALASLLKANLTSENYEFIKVSKCLTNPVRYYTFTEQYYEKQRNQLINKL